MSSKRKRKAANADDEKFSPPLLDKLGKVLGMLGSQHDGEVLAAGRRAHIMVTAAGWTWPGLLGLARISEPPPPPPPPAPPPPSPECRMEARHGHGVHGAAGQPLRAIRDGFLASILPQLRRGRQLSDKQLAWLCRLHERALDQAGARP